MDALTEKLGIKLQEWKPEISDSAKQTLRERVSHSPARIRTNSQSPTN
jgi:hypothetical protein